MTRVNSLINEVISRNKDSFSAGPAARPGRPPAGLVRQFIPTRIGQPDWVDALMRDYFRAGSSGEC